MSRKIRSKKQYGSVIPMTHVLETCGPNRYANAHGLPKWENVMVDE